MATATLRFLCIVAGLLCVVARPAGAQHGPLLDGAGPEERQGCGMCHGAHGGAANGRMLRVDESTPASAWGARIGTVTRSCLRCHATITDRQMQPEFQGAALASDRALLGFDLTDDHPLGGDLGRDVFSGSVLDDALRAPSAIGLESGSVLQSSSLECTTCHDPHARTDAVPSPEEEALLCASCHGAGAYAYGSHRAVACSGCHALHGSRGRSLLRESDSDAVCATCHPAGGISGGAASLVSSAEAARIAASVLASIIPGGHATPPEGRCVECHPVHE